MALKCIGCGSTNILTNNVEGGQHGIKGTYECLDCGYQGDFEND